ncbi:MAG: hypothetical protein KatS3mg082_0601 [Nitrospiraceae bacterium]|nr:MAG: hypothetical protein KatS3mg082_0601 [Nitrospiraceae bacterium]
MRDGALVWDEIRQVADLPEGWRETQEPGRYRLERTGSGRLFDVVHGPESLKRFAFAAREPLLTIERKAGGVSRLLDAPKTGADRDSWRAGLRFSPVSRCKIGFFSTGAALIPITKPGVTACSWSR